ncbi:MAG: type IX secretion system membrane protein PorP/SprF [Cytophagales bacterium]|nr:MAG: type IX secretion system membrane protein PorP/SprF [Cytophagales bacterium]
MLRKLFLLCCFIQSIVLQAQHLPIYSHYFFNPLVLNPAYAGNEKGLRINSIYRKQWLGFDTEDATTPNTLSLSMDTPLRNKSSSIGTILTIDRLGVSQITDHLFIFAQRINLSHQSTISLGIQFGYANHRSNYSKLDLDNDPVFQDIVSTTATKMGLGINLNVSKVFISISLPQYYFLKNQFRNNNFNPTFSTFFYSQIGYELKVNTDLYLKPNILWRYYNYQNIGNMDLNLLMYYKKNYGIGCSYRHKNALIALLEYKFRQLSVGYAYDFSTSELRRYNSGSHEFMLRYVFHYGINAINPKTFR